VRLVHVHEKADFFGGVEQILHDTARGLAGLGWEQALLHQSGSANAAFTEPFTHCSDDSDLLQRFQPDAVLIHKTHTDSTVSDISQRWPSLRMLHDHDLVCLRRHKYTPLSNHSCERPAGHSCYTHLCFVTRNQADTGFPLRLKTVAARKRDIASHQYIRRFIVGSQWMQQSLTGNGIDARRVAIINPIPACLDTARALPPSDAAEILCVGQIIRGKGVDLLLRALAITPGSWHATIVGSGNHLEQCRALARQLGIATRVTFTGRVAHEDLQNYYQRARFTVVPSRWPEPFGMVGIEAMARGRPVIGFAAGGIGDWLRDGENGILVPQANIAQLAQAMSRLLQETDTVRQLGDNAARIVAKHYTHQRYLGQLDALLKASL
jgi:glycosyltransferase involved in cell wall biosynthesis